jgi:hypothetical protein
MYFEMCKVLEISLKVNKVWGNSSSNSKIIENVNPIDLICSNVIESLEDILRRLSAFSIAQKNYLGMQSLINNLA